MSARSLFLGAFLLCTIMFAQFCQGQDCNNGCIPGGCEFEAGTVFDINHNQIPDSCEDFRGACCTNSGCTDTYFGICGFSVCNVMDWVPVSQQGCFGDVNSDGVVTPLDRGFMSANLGATDGVSLCLYDLDGSGTVCADTPCGE